MTIQELAAEAGGWFETARRATGDTETGPREDGEEFVRVRDGAPEWVTELAREAHGRDSSGAPAMLPDDWRYACTWAALDAMADAGDVDDYAAEFADGYVDVYTGARLAWLGSNLTRAGYVDEAREQFGDAGGVVEAIGQGQYMEAGEVYGLVLEFLRRRSEELEELELEEAGDGDD